jgi:serine O-acetyltransferase
MNDILADYRRYKPGRKGGFFPVLLLAMANIGFRAVLFYRLARACRRRGLSIPAGLLDRMNLQWNHCSINSNARIGPGLRIAHVGGLVIGGKTQIGANCDIRQNTTLGGNSGKRRPGDDAWTQPKLGDDVRIGCHVAILGPIRIADGAVIGACALVINDIDEPGTYAGVPARRLQ